MPYANLPRSQWAKMDRCVTDVRKTGKDKQAAIAICYTSIAGARKEHAARVAPAITSAIAAMVTLKAPKYDARAGEVIAGNLKRGNDGKFTRADGSAAGGREVVNALTKKPKGAKGGKAKLSADAQAKIGEQAGVDSEDFAALSALSKGTKPSDTDAQRLVELGLAERGTDGTLRMSSNSRGLLRAAQSGDVQAARDALSRGRDKVSRAADAEAKRNQRATDAQNKRAAADQKRTQADQRRNDQRAKRQDQRKADELDRVTSRVDEVEALVKSDTNVTEPERVRRVNQLDALEKRLDRVGVDKNDPQRKRIDQLRRKLNGDTSADTSADAPVTADQVHKELAVFNSDMRGGIAVFKDLAGRWRWVTRSSNAFRDREREIVSEKSLQADTNRTDVEAFGPLRFWHVGKVLYDTPLDWRTARAGAGLDLGTCDFRAIEGRMLIESGTFKEGAPVEAIAGYPDGWEISIGFAKPFDEPDRDGVYHNIRVFERSLVPKGKAANPFTSIEFMKDKEGHMASLKEKWDAFVALFGSEEKARVYAAQTDEARKELESAGVAFKSTEATATDATATEAKKDAPVADTADAVNTADVASVEEKADAPADGTEGTDGADGGDGGDTPDTTFVGDMTIEELTAALAPAIAQAMASAMQPAMAELDSTKAALVATQKELTELKTAKTKEATDTAGKLTDIDKRVKELEGDAPTRGYRPTGDPATIKEMTTVAPQAEDDISRLANWVITPAKPGVNGNGQHGAA